MRGRDIVLVGGLLLVTAVAVVDAFRDGDGRGVVLQEQPPPPPPRAPRAQPEAPENYPRGLLRGILVMADADNCRIRVLDLAGGRERPVNRRQSNCEVWPAPGGGLVAYGLDDEGFALVDLGESITRGDLGTVSESIGAVFWSPDTSRIAWCSDQGVGFELHVTEARPRTLRRCPIAYTGTGELAFAVGNRLVADGRTVLHASAPIHYTSWGNDGSIAVVDTNSYFQRWEAGRRDAVTVSGRLVGGPPVFAPDNCAALFQDVDQAWFEVIALDCFQAERPDLLLFGDSADVAWSPDGRWIAVAYSDRIGFHRVADGEEVAAWPVRAGALAWTAD
jgi:hypothetical protein